MNAFFSLETHWKYEFFYISRVVFNLSRSYVRHIMGFLEWNRKKKNIHIADPWNYASKAHCVSNPKPRHTGSTKDKCSYMNIRLLFFNAPAGVRWANRRLGRMGIYVHHKVFQKLLHKWLLTTVHSRLLHNNNL